MSLESVEIFIKWLDEMEAKKGWSDYRLSVETGLSSSVFSKARQGILPKWDALVRIAKAFDVPPTTAFQKAGLLPPPKNNDPWVEDMNHKISQLTGNRREMAERLLETLLMEQDRLEQSHTLSPKTKPAKT